MNFSIHLDAETLARLADAVRRTGLARNRIIGLAVQQWLARNEEKDWSGALASHLRNPAPELAEETLEFQGWRTQMPPESGTQW